ncbi:carbamoyltransferase family protein [Bremerella alba]|uniref:Decarbamoylnovobiocin carbamoyltransferase n=1 Tax=Bremerella alba TaxID=980252 RepID=A0A7V9A6F3_9BACT|nr:carbamoyltransferase [Bremerella alba]MBA2113886.1 Decarbamoylnovobiocin carbamoyltransferase [Bremerella alba]
MTWILGISAYYHDSAVALVKDGEIRAAASEERFSRRKHDAGFPELALKACLEHAGIGLDEIDYVGYYEKPLLKFERLLETYLACTPRGYASFCNAMPVWLRTKLYLPREIRRQLGGAYQKRIVFSEHHESHAASAFFPSPFESAAILTIDGVGEWTTTSWGVGHGNKIDLRAELKFPHSLGLLYSALTYFCGFRVNSGEYKLMGLAPYGTPKYADTILEHLIQLRDDGSYRLNMKYFGFLDTLRMTNQRFATLFGASPRGAEEPIRQIDLDLAASVQHVTEEVVLRMARHVHQQTGEENLCLAGGVALNCVANGRLMREGPFKRIWIQPAAGDAGGSLGVALLIWHQLLGGKREVQQVSSTTGVIDQQQGSLLGPAVDDDAEVERLIATGAVATKIADDVQLMRKVAELINDGNVIGWVQGRMEFGPRALGSRSILGDPRNREMQTTMNLKIKFRESFRPFAPSVMEEHASECFVFPDRFRSPEELASPYMLFTYDVQPGRRITVTDEPTDDQLNPQLRERVREVRSDLPAITHVDYSARVQTVSAQRHPRFHQLLSAFHQLTGCPALINTSFNVRGEPIVGTAADAYRCFLATHMDVLVVGNWIFYHDQQPNAARIDSKTYLTNLEPD